MSMRDPQYQQVFQLFLQTLFMYSYQERLRAIIEVLEHRVNDKMYGFLLMESLIGLIPAYILHEKHATAKQFVDIHVESTDEWLTNYLLADALHHGTELQKSSLADSLHHSTEWQKHSLADALHHSTDSSVTFNWKIEKDLERVSLLEHVSVLEHVSSDIRKHMIKGKLEWSKIQLHRHTLTALDLPEDPKLLVLFESVLSDINKLEVEGSLLFDEGKLTSLLKRVRQILSSLNKFKSVDEIMRLVEITLLELEKNGGALSGDTNLRSSVDHLLNTLYRLKEELLKYEVDKKLDVNSKEDAYRIITEDLLPSVVVYGREGQAVSELTITAVRSVRSYLDQLPTTATQSQEVKFKGQYYQTELAKKSDVAESIMLRQTVWASKDSSRLELGSESPFEGDETAVLKALRSGFKSEHRQPTKKVPTDMLKRPLRKWSSLPSILPSAMLDTYAKEPSFMDRNIDMAILYMQMNRNFHTPTSIELAQYKLDSMDIMSFVWDALV